MANESDNLGHFIKNFTIIDFLGYLVPGAFVCLGWEYYFGGLKDLFISFFGEQSLFLPIYFLIIAYLAGTLFHEVGYWGVNFLFYPFECQKMRCRESEGSTLKNYNILFKETNRKTSSKFCKVTRMFQNICYYILLRFENSKIPLFHAFATFCRTSATKGNGKKGPTLHEVRRRYRHIYHYIQPQLENSKIPLFHAFATFCRTSAVVVVAVFVMRAIQQGLELIHVILGIILFLLLLVRGFRFRVIIISYVYDIFDQVCIEKIPSCSD